MPELGPKDPSFLHEVRNLHQESKSKQEYLSSEVISELAKQYNSELVGRGVEAVVLSHSDTEEKVIAFNYKDLDPTEAKHTFYMHRVFSALFPHNFPHFYASSPEVNVRERINEGKLSQIKEFIKLETGLSITRHPFDRVEKICEGLGIELQLDRSHFNFIYGTDGGEYYLDRSLNSNLKDWDIEKISAYMHKKKYPSEEIEIVLNSVERLKELSASQ